MALEFRYCGRNGTQPAQASTAHTYSQGRVSYITGYVFSILCYIDFAETDITCYIDYYISNRNLVQNILYITTLLLSLSPSLYMYILITPKQHVIYNVV